MLWNSTIGSGTDLVPISQTLEQPSRTRTGAITLTCSPPASSHSAQTATKPFSSLPLQVAFSLVGSMQRY